MYESTTNMELKPIEMIIIIFSASFLSILLLLLLGIYIFHNGIQRSMQLNPFNVEHNLTMFLVLASVLKIVIFSFLITSYLLTVSMRKYYLIHNIYILYIYSIII